VAAARVDESSKVALAAYMRLQLIAIQQSRGRVVAVLVQFARPLFQFLEVPRLDRDVNMVCVVVAIDRVLADQ